MMPGKLIANRFAIKDPEKDLPSRGGMGEVYRTRKKINTAAIAP